ncbi:hypothetical protein BCR39DRAFT_585297 [Naematelia encephala]|uniref:Uncharacterized protein n=1 Tax=Naematelia encephala TaxID=71784 RepID=A0A1Y2BLP4_9TREE|nr:hypothetical protein BCR39DRAFT_585297 [Naematelia encephala]
MSDSMGDTTLFIVAEADPYLQYQPAFAYSLPIQLLVNGITLTLLCVLLIHLLITTQYHYPLAPLNYVLQLLSIVVVLMSVIIKTAVVLRHSAVNADTWPYDLDYVAVPIPPDWWNTGQDAAWFLLQALNNGLSNATHIQFLTLLYPSRVEARLIIFVLGPLALGSSGLYFTALSGHQVVLDIGDSIRNVLNSTLLLIFTLALFIWGFVVNRRRAWRLDGGTAVFGAAALFLAVVSTTFNFVEVAEDGIDWMQHLLFSAILWQTWLGWWWWVGSGMGIGEVEDLMERQERKKRKAARRAAKQRASASAQNRAANAAQLKQRASTLMGDGATAMVGFTTSVAGILRNRSGTLSRRRTIERIPAVSGDIEEALPEAQVIAMTPIRSRTSVHQAGYDEAGPSTQPRVEFNTPPGSRGINMTNSETSSTSATPSLHVPQSVGQFLAFPATWIQVYFRRLRHAHEDATKRQAIERAERRQQVLGGATSTSQGTKPESKGKLRAQAARQEAAIVNGDELGWGLGKFGIKEQQESARRLTEARVRTNEQRLLPEDAVIMDDEEAEPIAGPSRPRRDVPLDNGDMEGLNEDMDLDEDVVLRDEVGQEVGKKNKVGEQEQDWEDVDNSFSSSSSSGPTNILAARTGPDRRAGNPRVIGGEAGTGWSWWGPLKNWRLSDRSTF